MINYLILSLLFYQAPLLNGKITNNYNPINQMLLLKNLTRIKRYNTENDLRWREELRQRENELVIRYFRFENSSFEEKKNFHYFRIPKIMRQKWIYEYYGRIAGFILAIFMAFAHHFFAFAYATIVWYIRRRRDIRYSAKIFAPDPIRNKYYEELEHLNFDKAAKLMEIMESETKETFIDEDEKEFNKLITLGITMQLEDEEDKESQETEKESEDEKPGCLVEGIIPFNLVGICGPYGERIIDRSIPLRDPLPDEKPPIVYNIEEIPKHLITDKQGFFGLIELAKNQTVIIKTDRTADGFLKGYYGGRIVEGKMNKNKN